MAWPSNSARTKTWGTEVVTSADVHTQLDLLHQYSIDVFNATTGHTHTGGTNTAPKIPLTTSVIGVLPLANGGTGQGSLASFLNLIYPIGSVYINVSDSTNPGTLLGFGTWAALGAGRMIVGYDAGDTSFDTAGETGGANTVTLTTTELPAHTHTVSTNISGSAFGSTAIANSGSAADTNRTSSSTGSGAAFSVLNKYVTCYTWKRTA